MNRTISCTVNEDALAKAFAFLMRHNYGSVTMAGIARLCVEIVASQVREELTEQEAKDFDAIASGVGRSSAKRPQMRGPVLQMQPARTLEPQPMIRADDRPWWQQLGCVSEDEAHRYTQFLRQHGVTARECSYTDWHKHQLGVKPIKTPTVPEGCDPSLPIAVNDSPEDLNERAAEREREAQEQKRLMNEFTRGLANGQTNSE